MPRLARILIYPLKSFDPIEVASAELIPAGPLANDRRFALVDSVDNFINAKSEPRVHPIRVRFSKSLDQISLSTRDVTEQSFDLHPGNPALEEWFTHYFGYSARIVENAVRGFPDDPDSPGPTVVSSATYNRLTEWFPGVGADELRLRFRANLEIEGVEPFWEDHLYGEPGAAVRFRIGSALLEGVNPCQRCPVPTRSPVTGEVYPRFAKTFAERREEQLPEWATRSRFNHFYRLTVNTKPSQPATIHVGDEVEIVQTAAV